MKAIGKLLSFLVLFSLIGVGKVSAATVQVSQPQPQYPTGGVLVLTDTPTLISGLHPRRLRS